MIQYKKTDLHCQFFFFCVFFQENGSKSPFSGAKDHKFIILMLDHIFLGHIFYIWIILADRHILDVPKKHNFICQLVVQQILVSLKVEGLPVPNTLHFPILWSKFDKYLYLFLKLLLGSRLKCIFMYWYIPGKEEMAFKAIKRVFSKNFQPVQKIWVFGKKIISRSETPLTPKI